MTPGDLERAIYRDLERLRSDMERVTQIVDEASTSLREYAPRTASVSSMRRKRAARRLRMKWK